MEDISSVLPWPLRHENIARIEGGKLLIGRRDRLPFERSFLEVGGAEGAAKAIKDMVTQGGGPLEAGLRAIVLEAMKGATLPELRKAADLLSAARPTNRTLALELDRLLGDLEGFGGKDGLAEKAESLVVDRLSDYDRRYESMGRLGSDLVPDSGGVLTTCFAEHSFFLSLHFARGAGKDFTVYAMETRPWFQGARLTAPGLLEMGYPHRLICDNAAGYVISAGRAKAYMTAADRATGLKWVCNKTGTLSCACLCKAFGIPYWAFSVGLDPHDGEIPFSDIEERFPREVKLSMGHPTTEEGVDALYPCFDIVPPEYVTGIVTPEGVLR